MTGTIDFETIKKNQRAGWETGDYPRVGNTLQIIAELLVEAADVRAGQTVLDVACGQGNAAMAAARRFAEATGVDYATNLLEQGRDRAAAEHLDVTFQEGDAEALPVPDQAFDLVVSTVGVMFAPNHQRAADELVRVTKPGGRIALACWTPTGMIGDLFKTVGKWAPPPAGVRPPTLWGTSEHLASLFGDRVEWTALTGRTYTFRYHPRALLGVVPAVLRPDHAAGRNAVGRGPGALRDRPRRGGGPLQPGQRWHGSGARRLPRVRRRGARIIRPCTQSGCSDRQPSSWTASPRARHVAGRRGPS
ncbi:class I SAM-dependent methyltransferase [Phytohabitans flavus]|uniref:class I SAM-dependent methyltransferase n=1 Tax=Phytohabitans flavus TaxID=1076124 RepID=UPI0036311EBC